MLITIKILERKPLKSGMMYEENGERLFLIGLLRITLVRISMKIQTPGTGGLARSISCHETGLPEKPPLQATRKGGKWRVVHPFRSTAHYSLTCNFDEPSSNIECKVELAYITIERNDKKMEHLPENLRNLRIPVIASPMFIISNPKLVIEQCKAGIVGSMPALNARPSSQLDEWLHEIKEELEAYNKKHPDKPAAPF